MASVLDAAAGDPYYTDSSGTNVIPDYGYGSATTYNPGANSFLDLLKFGIGHYASYQTAALNKPTTAAPKYVNAAQPTQSQEAVKSQLVKFGLIGGAVFLGVVLLSKLKG